LFLAIAALIFQIRPIAPWTSAAAQQSGSPVVASSLDFEGFRTKVQPVLTRPRKGNARCTACHSRGGGNAYLEPLTPGSLAYSEEQSQRNFQRVQRLVVPGEPLK